jgi:hypothetical protein
MGEIFRGLAEELAKLIFICILVAFGVGGLIGYLIFKMFS